MFIRRRRVNVIRIELPYLFSPYKTNLNFFPSFFASSVAICYYTRKCAPVNKYGCSPFFQNLKIEEKKSRFYYYRFIRTALFFNIRRIMEDIRYGFNGGIGFISLFIIIIFFFSKRRR